MILCHFKYLVSSMISIDLSNMRLCATPGQGRKMKVHDHAKRHSNLTMVNWGLSKQVPKNRKSCTTSQSSG